MPKKITDITKKVEDPQSQEAPSQLEQIKELPGQFEIEKKPEIAVPEAVPSPLKVEEKKEEVVVYPIPTPPPSEPAKSPVLEKIENVLQEDLEDIYFQMPLEKQVAFKEEGEVTASKIAVLLGSVKVQVKKILSLIVEWLRIIPHVNKYFLEQEAKIKTDKLLEMKDKGEIPSSGNQNKI